MFRCVCPVVSVLFVDLRNSCCWFSFFFAVRTGNWMIHGLYLLKTPNYFKRKISLSLQLLTYTNFLGGTYYIHVSIEEMLQRFLIHTVKFSPKKFESGVWGGCSHTHNTPMSTQIPAGRRNTFSWPGNEKPCGTSNPHVPPADCLLIFLAVLHLRWDRRALVGPTHMES